MRTDDNGQSKSLWNRSGKWLFTADGKTETASAMEKYVSFGACT